MWNKVGENTERGAAPTVGIVLATAVVIILAAVAGVLAFSLTDSTNEGPPTGSFETVELSNGIQINHKSGDTFDAENLYLLYDGEKQPVTNFTSQESLLAGDSIGPVDPDGSSQLVLTWEGDGESYIIHVADAYDTLDFSTGGPSISTFSASNPSGQNVDVSLDSDEQLSAIELSISGAESATLTKGDFSETVSGGTYTYDATYSGSTDGDYTATLNTAEDSSGNDGASGQSATTTVTVLNDGSTVVYEGLSSVSGDNGETSSLNPSGVKALGPSGSDLTGDGSNDLPYIDGSGNLKLSDGTGNTQTLVSDSDPSDPAESKTLMAVTEWQGSDTSVFYADSNNAKIYRVTDSGSPTVVATPGNGAQAVMGTGDIDGDGTDELLFADGSQQVRYLEPSGTIKKLTNGQAGSNNGIGVGEPPDFDGDGTVRVAIADGSNNVKIVGDAESTKTFPSTSTVKAPVTTSDVDDDSKPEVVYVSDSGINNGPDKPLRYIDDPFGSTSIELLEDKNGDPIDGDGELGVVS